MFAGSKISAFDSEDIDNNFVDTIVITTCKVQNLLLDILDSYKDKINIITLFDI